MEKVEHQTDSRLLYLAEFFKVFGDFTRLRIINLLEDSELCVNDIAEKLRMNQSAISHQLRMLKQNRLVKQRREGKTVFYSLDDRHVVDIFRQGIEHISEQD
jgi:ArsR family transcriptional regulator